MPVSGSAFALLGSSGAETKFSVVALDSLTCIDVFAGHNSCEFAQLFCLRVFVVALRSSGRIVQL